MIGLLTRAREALAASDQTEVGGWILLADLILFMLLAANWAAAARITIRPSRRRRADRR